MFKQIRAKKAKGYWPTSVEIAWVLFANIAFFESWMESKVQIWLYQVPVPLNWTMWTKLIKDFSCLPGTRILSMKLAFSRVQIWRKNMAILSILEHLFDAIIIKCLLHLGYVSSTVCVMNNCGRKWGSLSKLKN
jgi:hypothetical protein